MPIKKKLEESNKNFTATTMTRRDRFIKNVDLTALLETFGTNVVEIEQFFPLSIEDKSIEDRVERAIQNVIKDYSLTFENQDKSFVQVLFDFDSLDFIEIIYSIGDEFAIVIPDDIMDGLDTFNKIVDYIRKLNL
jgi:acyl carrier protein